MASSLHEDHFPLWELTSTHSDSWHASFCEHIYTALHFFPWIISMGRWVWNRKSVPIKTDECFLASTTTTAAWKGGGGWGLLWAHYFLIFWLMPCEALPHQDMQRTQGRRAWPISHTQKNRHTNKFHPPTSLTWSLSLAHSFIVGHLSWKVKGLIHTAWQNVHF